jgi:methionyl-tRNA formyltransferase
MLQVAFAGTPEFAVQSLRAIAGSAHRLVGVLTQPDRPAGRGRTLTASPIKRLALELGLPVAQPPSLKSESERAVLAGWVPDVLVVVAYGLILPTAALAIPHLGGINVHASLLPRWRGAAPVQRAILAGDANTGITIMQMAAGLDTGPMLMQRSVSIGAAQTALQLLDTLAELGAGLLTKALDGLELGTLHAVDQPADGATYAAKIDKREAQIDWRQSAQQIARQVRAFNPWPVAQTLWEQQQLRVWEAHAVDAAGSAPPGQVLALEQGGLLIQCADGALSITKLQQAGRRVVSAGEFAGNRKLIGMRFG